MFVKFKPISIRSLIGTTINYVVYNHKKHVLLFGLNNNLETLMYVRNISLDHLFTKNREYVPFNTIVSIPIKDIGWDTNDCLFIVDENGDVYRVKCTDIDLCMYNYTLYKMEKKAAQEKREVLKAKIFGSNSYSKI